MLNALDQSIDAGSFWGETIQDAAQVRGEPGRRGQPALEDLGGVGLDQEIAGARRRLKRGSSGVVTRFGPIGRRGAPDKRMLGLGQCFLQLGRRAQTHLHPVGQLVADVVELAPGQLHGQHVGRGPLGQGGRPHDRHAMPLDRPGHEQAAALGRVSHAAHQAIPQLDRQTPRGPIKAGDVRLAIIGRPLRRFVRGKPELHYPHGTLSARRDETAS